MNEKKSILRFFSPEATVFDICIFIYAQFFLFGLVPVGGKLIDVLPRHAGFIIGFTMLIFIPFYLARMMKNYKFDGRAKIFHFVYFFIFSFLVFYINQLNDLLTNRSTTMGEVLLGIVGGIVIGMAGWILGGFVFENDFGKAKIFKLRDKIPIHPGTIQFFVVAWVVAAVVAIYQVGISSSGFFSFIFTSILYLLLSALAAAILVPVFSYPVSLWKKLVNARPRIEKSGKLVVSIVYTMLAVLLITIWLELIMLEVKQGDGWQVLFMITVSGYLPVRLIMEFQPPFTVVNIFTGLAGSAYLIFRLLSLG